jgi:NHL repeat
MAQAANLDTTADRVFGQPGFTSSTINNGALSAHSLNFPTGVALDAQSAQGNLYVADSFNSRVLEYDTPLSSGTTGDWVFGQPNFYSPVISNGGVSASSLYVPGGVALDGWGNLYVADLDNSRVLEYNTPLSADTTADPVFGQPDFAQGTPNSGGVSANSLSGPEGVAVDKQGNLYVADYGNNRVLEYDWALVKINLPLVRH